MKQIKHYGMFTDKGNYKVDKIVNKLIKNGISIDHYMNFDDMDKYFGKLSKKKKYEEVSDTSVREHIVIALNKN